MVNQLLFASAVGLAGIATAALDTILPLPPMGFNTWARFMTNVSEGSIINTAEDLIKTGLFDAGFNRINLDDGWSTMSRADNGSRVWDSKKFPGGFLRLTSRLKSMNISSGIFTSAGITSCAGYPGSLDHEEIDHRDFVAWGFDFVKVDGCNLPVGDATDFHIKFRRWHELLSGSDMMLSSSAPKYFSGRQNLTDFYTVMGWSQGYGQLARHSTDIQNFPYGDAWGSMRRNYDSQKRLGRYQTSGFFNDPDSLNFDHPSYTLDEKKSHFAILCSLSAPIFLSANLSAITTEMINVLTNKDLIAINQDQLVQQATLVSSDERSDILTKSLENGDRLVTVLNKGNTTSSSITIEWYHLGLNDTELYMNRSDITIKDLWAGDYFHRSWWSGIPVVPIPPHGTAVYRVAKTASSVTPSGLIFNTNSMNCLTDDTSGKVTFKKCNGSIAQIWRVNSDGTICSILRYDIYQLEEVNGQILTVLNLHKNPDSWAYHISGNLFNSKSRLCLTEGKDGAAMATPCGYEANDQVVALPVGVTVIGN